MYKNFKAFTLAEVLITLGIIGVIAALTIPSIIQANRNREVSAKLKQVYTIMNQAIMLSENDNGPKEDWPYCSGGTSGCTELLFSKYVLPYIKYTKYELFQSFGGTNIVIYFANGTILVGKPVSILNGIDFFFITSGKYFDIENFSSKNDDGEYTTSRKGSGATLFSFALSPNYPGNHYKKGFEPYQKGDDIINEKELKYASNYGCYKGEVPAFCTALIRYNGWNIPKDYPYKVK